MVDATVAEVLGGPHDGRFLYVAVNVAGGSRVRVNDDARGAPIPAEGSGPTPIVLAYDYSSRTYIVSKRTLWAGWPSIPRSSTMKPCIICGGPGEVALPDGRGEQRTYCGTHEPEGSA